MSAAPTRAPRSAATSAPFQPPNRRPREADASASVIASVLLLLNLGARDHRYVLGAEPVGRSGGKASKRMLGIGESEARLGLEIVALGGRQGGTTEIAFPVVDDSELVPGEGIGIVAAN